MKTLSGFVCLLSWVFAISAPAHDLDQDRRALSSLDDCGVRGNYTRSSFLPPEIVGYYKITHLPELRCPSDRWMLLFDDAGYAALRALWLQGVPVAFDLSGTLRGQYLHRPLKTPTPSQWPDVKETAIVLGAAADRGLLVQLNQMYQDLAAHVPHRLYDQLWPLFRDRKSVETLVDFAFLTRAFAAAIAERNMPDYPILYMSRHGLVREPPFLKFMQRKFNYSEATVAYHQAIGIAAAALLKDLRESNLAKHTQVMRILADFVTPEQLTTVGKWKYLGTIATDIACTKDLALPPSPESFFVRGSESPGVRGHRERDETP